jgi:hypothetical protein
MTASSGSSKSGQAVAPLSLDHLASKNTTTEQACAEISKLFKVGKSETALYRLERGFLNFLVPAGLKVAGTIPLSSSSAVSARTATSKKAELFNNFSKVKHAGVFEQVKLAPTDEQRIEQLPIQKLISAPILDEDGDVLGVIQVCRKGLDQNCGPDFSLEDLQRLEQAARVLARAPFMQPETE